MSDVLPPPYEGPHLWLNWQGLLVGQPARSSSFGDSTEVHPLWEERALYSDAHISGELEFGPYALLMTLAGAGSAGRVGRAVQTLVFRHRDHLFEAPLRQMREELDVGGWTGGDIGDQAAALCRWPSRGGSVPAAWCARALTPATRWGGRSR